MSELIKSRDTRGWAARREWRGSPPERGTLSERRFPDSPRGPPKRRLTKRKTDRTSLSFGRKHIPRGPLVSEPQPASFNLGELWRRQGMWRETEKFPFVAAAVHCQRASNEPVKEHRVINNHLSWPAIPGVSTEQGRKNLEEQVTLVQGLNYFGFSNCLTQKGILQKRSACD